MAQDFEQLEKKLEELEERLAPLEQAKTEQDTIGFVPKGVNWALTSVNSISPGHKHVQTEITDLTTKTTLDSLDDVAAITEAQGQIIHYGGSSAWDALSPGTSGYFLKTQGAAADPIWSNLNKLLSLSTSTTSANNTTDETNIFSTSVAGGTLGTGNAIRLSIYCQLTPGSTDTLTVRLKYGSTTMITITTGDMPDSASQGWITAYVMADGATNAQDGVLQLSFAPNTFRGDGGSDGKFTAYYTDEDADAAEDSTSAQNLVVSVEWSSTNSTFSKRFAICESLIV